MKMTLSSQQLFFQQMKALLFSHEVATQELPGASAPGSKLRASLPPCRFIGEADESTPRNPYREVPYPVAGTTGNACVGTSCLQSNGVSPLKNPLARCQTER